MTWPRPRWAVPPLLLTMLHEGWKMSFILSLVNAQCLLTLFVRIISPTCHIAPQLTLTVVGQCGSWANALKRCLGCCNDDQAK